MGSYHCAKPPEPPPPVCGDGKYESNLGHECDDGNLESGDGCSETCTLEPGYSCDGQSPTSCYPICNDGILVPPEECDFGWEPPEEDCPNCQVACINCKVYGGYTCDARGCEPICGDGYVNAGEGCDDGGLVDEDGCTASCTVEAGWVCSGQPSVCMPS